jgi:hypothetical protein
MSHLIYEDKARAKAACEEYVRTIHSLQEKLGVWEENEDSCSATWTYARYRDESGKVVDYCHS